jgi:pyruvate kinase
VEFVALSFTRGADDVREARAHLDALGLSSTKIIAKIENKEGLVNCKGIIEAADAVTLSRGSMGNCLDPEKMFLAQKMLLSVGGVGWGVSVRGLGSGAAVGWGWSG